MQLILSQTFPQIPIHFYCIVEFCPSIRFSIIADILSVHQTIFFIFKFNNTILSRQLILKLDE